MDVSIVITNYNYAIYLERAVRSCYRQRYDREKYEIIIVDDASNDHSVAVIKSIVKKYKDLNIQVVFNKKNVGLSASRNKGILSAMGRYVTNLDADDYYDEDFLYFTLKYLNLNPETDALAVDYITVDDNENHLKRYSSKEYSLACGIVFRKKIFHNFGLYDESFLMCEEEELMKRIAENCKIDNLSIPLYRYRRHDNNMTNDIQKHMIYKAKLQSSKSTSHTVDMKKYLLSQQYVTDMLQHVDQPYEKFVSFLYDASYGEEGHGTQNYLVRAHELAQKLGAWRWKGIFTYRNQFIDLIFNESLQGIDFGGAHRPVAKNIDIVDISDTDLYGRPVKYSSLSQVDHDLDFVFSSHTLEHVPDLDNTVELVYEKLKSGGTFALNLPSYSCPRWHAFSGYPGIDHVHTFKLSKSDDIDLPHMVVIDDLLEEKGFKIVTSEYTGDDSIVIFAKKE